MRRARFGRDSSGASAVEFALIAPLLLVMIAGAYELGSFIRARTTVEGIAQQMATTWAGCRKSDADCNAELSQFTTALPILAPHLPWTETVSWSGNLRVRITAGRFQMQSAAPATGYTFVYGAITPNFTPHSIAALEDTNWRTWQNLRPIPLNQNVVQVNISMEYRSQVFRAFADQWWDSNCQNEDCEANEIWASGTALAPRS